MDEVNLTDFRGNIRRYYDLVLETGTPLKITNRKNKKGDAVLISAEEYERLLSAPVEGKVNVSSDMESRLAAYMRSLSELTKRVERLEKSK